jgi:tetratricopeptide (TPR) repeat protein
MLKSYILSFSNKAQLRLCFVGLIIYFLCFHSVYANNPQLDSLIKVKDITKNPCDKAWIYVEIAKTAFNSDMKLSLDYVKEGIELAKDNGCNENLANLYISQSIILVELNKIDDAIKVIDKAIFLYQKKVNKPLNLAKAFLAKGNAYLTSNYLNKALDNYLQSLNSVNEIDEDKEVVQFKAMLYGDIAGLYSKLKQYDSSLFYLQKSIETLPITNDPARLIKYHLNLSTIYMVKDSFELALMNVNKADSANLAFRNPFYQIDINLNKAYIFSFMERHLEALELMRATEKIVSSSSAFSGAYHNFMHKYSKVYYKAKKYKESIAISLEHLKNTDLEKDERQIANVMYNLYLSYKALGDFQNALKYQEEYYRLVNEIQGENTQNEINRLKEEYEASKKEREIILLKEKDHVSQLEIQQKNDALKIRLYFILFLVFFFLSLFVFLYYRLQQNKLKEQNKIAELERITLRAQMNPHFIFNALNSIQRIYVEGDIKKANNYMADFSRLMRKILENSNLNVITLSEEIETLGLYLELEKLRSKDSFTYQIHIDDSLSLNAKVPPLLFQPFVENSIWHGVLPLENNKGHITIKILDFDEDTMKVIIEDNGVGFDTKIQTENKKSKGISITRQRIGNSVLIESTPNVGTIVSFKLAKKYD